MKVKLLKKIRCRFSIESKFLSYYQRRLLVVVDNNNSFFYDHYELEDYNKATHSIIKTVRDENKGLGKLNQRIRHEKRNIKLWYNEKK